MDHSSWVTTSVDTTELILLCLVAVALLAIVARKISVPYPILLTVAGGGLALVPGLPVIHLEPKLVFDLFLPPLLYPAAVFTSWRDFRANLRSILPLATFLVLLTMGATACLFHALTGLPLAVGFVFGAPSPTGRRGRVGGDAKSEGAPQVWSFSRARAW